MSAEMQLAEVPPKETALQVYSSANGLDPFLQKIREEIDSFVPDVATRKGRGHARGMRQAGNHPDRQTLHSAHHYQLLRQTR